MPVDHAGRRDQTIDGLADCAASLTKSPEIHSSRDCQFLAAGSKQFEFPKFAPDLGKCFATANSLKNLTENEVGQSKTLPRELVIEPLCFAIAETTEIVNPHGGINDHHCGDDSLKRPAGSDANRPPIGSCREGGAWKSARASERAAACRPRLWPASSASCRCAWPRASSDRRFRCSSASQWTPHV